MRKKDLLKILPGNNFVAFPAFGWFGDAENNSVKIFIRPRVDNPKKNIRAIYECDGNIENSEIFKIIKKRDSSEKIVMDIRPKELAFCNKDNLMFFLTRHQGFMGNFSDIIEQSIFYCSYTFIDNSDSLQEEKIPPELKKFLNSQVICEAPILINFMNELNEEFMSERNIAYPEVPNLQWEKNGTQLDYFQIKKDGEKLSIFNIETEEAVFKGFNFLLEAQLNVESLVCYLYRHPQKNLLRFPTSVVDYFLLDVYPRNTEDEMENEDEDENGYGEVG